MCKPGCNHFQKNVTTPLVHPSCNIDQLYALIRREYHKFCTSEATVSYLLNLEINSGHIPSGTHTWEF